VELTSVAFIGTALVIELSRRAVGTICQKDPPRSFSKTLCASRNLNNIVTFTYAFSVRRIPSPCITSNSYFVENWVLLDCGYHLMSSFCRIVGTSLMSTFPLIVVVSIITIFCWIVVTIIISSFSLIVVTSLISSSISWYQFNQNFSSGIYVIYP